MKQRIFESWNRFFFSAADNRIYLFLRIAVGAILAIYLVVLFPNWIRWFGDQGVLPREFGQTNIDEQAWSVFYWLPGKTSVLYTAFAVIAVQTLLLIAGVYPRFQIACLFVWFLSLHHRNNLIWEGGDILLRITLFLMIFMPLGNRLSAAPMRCSQFWPLRLLQLQQSLLYLSSAGQKLSGSDWVDGIAFYYVTRLDDFYGRLFPWVISPDLLWLSRLVCWFTISLEFLLAFAVWVPSLRRSAVLLGIAFHLALELSMNLFLFQWLMIVILATHLFPPPSEERHAQPA